MRKLLLVILCGPVLVVCGVVAAPTDQRIPIIFDTDFVMPPSDDSMALMLALQSPEIQILGVTTVAGNDSVERATADVLRMLEIANQAAIPVYQGADMPLVHAKSEFAVREYGNWYSNDQPPKPPGGFARKRVEDESAASFIVRAILANPHQVTIVAIGPLTNIAMALRAHPELPALIKRIVIMGGAIALLPDGAGNITPNAEFNFWVDPEAAYATLRSGMNIELSPLNISRKSSLTKTWYEKIVAIDTPLTGLLRKTLGRRFDDDPAKSWHMYDQIAMASVIDPSLVTKERLYVDVNIDHGISYGVSIGGREIWPGAEGAQQMDVQYELDWERFIRMFSERVQRPLAANNSPPVQ